MEMAERGMMDGTLELSKLIYLDCPQQDQIQIKDFLKEVPENR